jgi:hypothetical protein
MITKSQAISLQHGDILHSNEFENADGSCERWRVTGKVKTWKTYPHDFKIPVKHGMYDHGYVTHHNNHNFHLSTECKKEAA